MSRRNSSYSGGDDVDAHLAKADKAMSTLQDLHSKQSSAWKKALKHRSGAIVYYSKEKQYAGPKKNGKDYTAPVYKGEMDIKGFSPAQVFGVVGTRNLWDEWYKEVSRWARSNFQFLSADWMTLDQRATSSRICQIPVL